MHISILCVIVCYNIIHCIVFNFVNIIVVLIFTNSPFLFILSKFATPPRAYYDLSPPHTYLILPNVPTDCAFFLS